MKDKMTGMEGKQDQMQVSQDSFSFCSLPRGYKFLYIVGKKNSFSNSKVLEYTLNDNGLLKLEIMVFHAS